MSLNMLRPLLVIAFLTGVGGWMTAWSWNHLRTDRLLEKGAAVIEGRMVDGSMRKLSRGGQSWNLVVEYTPQGGKPITRNFDVDGETYRAAMASGTATVSYVPEKPEISRVTRFETMPFQILMGLGGLMVLAGLFCIRHVMRKGLEAGA